MRKKKNQRQAAKELYPGAGTLALDWAHIKGDDFDEVERWLEEVGDGHEKLAQLIILKEHFLYEAPKVAEKIREAEKQTLPPWGVEPDRQSRNYIEQAQAFGSRLDAKRKQLSSLYSIEKRKLVRVNDDESETGTDQLTIAQCVWAAHYLLLESGLSYATVDKTIVARFISALTGYGFENVYKRVRDKHGKNEKATQQDLGAVGAWFKAMGLEGIAKKIEAERNIG